MRSPIQRSRNRPCLKPSLPSEGATDVPLDDPTAKKPETRESTARVEGEVRPPRVLGRPGKTQRPGPGFMRVRARNFITLNDAQSGRNGAD